MAKEGQGSKDSDNTTEEPKAGVAMPDSAELREQLLRLAAEFDNYKKRTRKDIEGAESNGKAVLLKGILHIIDEFELAMLALNESKDRQIARGVEMLYSNFTETLKKEGLAEIEAEGIFDPYRHEIVMVRESDEREGTILEVVKKGYMFDGRLLRPASVIIAKERGAAENGKNEKAKSEQDPDKK